MRKKNSLVLLCTLIINTTFASDHSMKVIYKWQSSDGLIHYTHIRPDNIEKYEKLDSSGRTVEDYTQDFGEVVEIVMKEKKKDAVIESKLPSDEELQLEANRKAEVKKKNCLTAQNNLKTIGTGEVYERDTEGNMVRLDEQQIESKRKNVLADIEKFCSQNEAQ
ncbi:MAG: hypothetical protein KGV50_01795 [Gammaproteobacteria bacterium]|nr:hypothetical protein [Gammaproteobacteria bacterium]